MAVLKTETIALGKVKTRWEEPFVSEAINRMFRVMPRGVYNGFVVEQKSTPGAGVTIKIPSSGSLDSVLVHKETASGFASVYREETSFDFNFTFDASAGILTLYIFVDVDYQVSTATQAFLRVGESSDRTSGKSVTLSKIVIPQSATTILDAYITQDTTDSDTITSPFPDTSVNEYGLLDSVFFGRIPTANQKDALDASESPSTSNRYITDSDLVDHTSHPKTYTISDGTLSTGGDFQGATAIESALTALESGDGGHIYVRRGNYTLATSKTFTKPIRIVCETLPDGPVNSECKLAATAAGADMTFQEFVEIKGLHLDMTMSTIGVVFEDRVLIEGVNIDGLVTFDNATVWKGGHVKSLRTDGQVVFTSSSFMVFDACVFLSGTASTYAVTAVDMVNTQFNGCLFDGTKTGTQDGGGVEMTGSPDGSSFNTCQFWAKGGVAAVKLLDSSGAIDTFAIRDCVVNLIDQVTVDAVQITVNSTSNIVIDGLKVIGAGAAYDLTDAFIKLETLGADNQITMNNTVIRANSVTVEIAATNIGVIRIVTASGASNDKNSITVDGLIIANLKASQTSLGNGGIIVVNSLGPEAQINLRRIHLSSWVTPTASSYLAAIRVNGLSGGGGVNIDECFLRGRSDLSEGAFTETWYGVYVDSQAEINHVIIQNSYIALFRTRDIETLSSGPMMRIIGCRGEGYGVVGGLTRARIHLYEGFFVVSNNYYEHGGDNEAGQTWLYVENTAAVTESSAISNNVIRMDSEARDAIYVDELDAGGNAAMVFTGNVGIGTINVEATDNHMGLGDISVGDNNLNRLSTTFR